MPSAPSDRRSATAAGLLARVFSGADVPLVFRFWDGTSTRVGAPGATAFAITFRSRPVFRRLLRQPTPLGFGEAFIAGEIDIEGDMFAAMDAASHIEHLRVPLGTRLAVLAGLLRT